MSRWLEIERDEREVRKERACLADALSRSGAESRPRNSQNMNRRARGSAPIAVSLFCCESVASTSGLRNGPR